MKRGIIVLLMVWHCSLLAVAQSDIVFDKVNHDFGTIEESDGVVSHTFKYQNTGKEPFVIIDVVTSCGCTIPSYSRAPLLKGEDAELTVTYDPTDLPGRIAKEIRVISNQGTLMLFIDGYANSRPRSIKERFPFDIGGGARLDGLGMTWLQVPYQDTIIRTINVANANLTIPITVDIDPESLPENISIQPFDNSVKPNSITPIEFVIHAQEYGSFISDVYFVVNGERKAEKIVLGGVVVDNFKDPEVEKNARAEFSTHYFSLGRVKRGETIRRELTLKNKGTDTLRIRAIEGTKNLSVTANNLEIAATQSTQILLEFKANSEGYANESVRIIVNDQSGALREVRATAEVID